MPLSKEKKDAAVTPFKRGANDTGSSEVQVARLTSRINDLTKHFKSHVKDHHSRRGLIRMVGRRKKLLRFVESESPKRYQELIAKLALRK